MSFRMHRYDDGLTGLAAFCDVCGEQITENGYIVWDTQDETDWLLIHQRICDPQGRYTSSHALGTEIVYLANSASIDLIEAQKLVGLYSQL